MNKILHNAPWVLSVTALVCSACFFYFALRGYSYIGHTRQDRVYLGACRGGAYTAAPLCS